MADPRRKKLVSRTIQAFEDLRGCKTELTLAAAIKSSYRAAHLLRTLYEVGVSKIGYTTEEQKKIGPLIETALFAVRIWVGLSVDQFPPHNNVAASKRERSGLQFLLDDYREFPRGDSGTISELLENFKVEEEVKEWGERLMDESYLVSFDIVEFDLSPEEKLRVPKWHRWCFDSLEIGSTLEGKEHGGSEEQENIFGKLEIPEVKVKVGKKGIDQHNLASTLQSDSFNQQCQPRKTPLSCY